MQFKINIVSVDVQTKPTAKGSYQVANLAYRNLNSGKLEEHKVFSFGAEKDLFSTASSVKAGQEYTITAQKGEKYWEWTAMEQQVPGTVAAADTATPVGKGNYQPRTYETAEERAERQVLIVRQSSLTNAVAVLSTGSKNPPDIEAVLQLAERFASWVFQKDAKVAFQKTETLLDMENDIPL